MVSFSQPQRINPYNNNSLSSQGGDYLRRVARSAPKADFRKGIGLGVPSAILGAPGDLSQLAASLPGRSIFDYAQMLNLLPPDKEKVKGYLEGLLNPQINDQEAYDTGSGLIADLLSPAAVLKGPQTVKRAIDYAVDQPGVFDGVGEVLMGGALGQKRFQNNIFVGTRGAPTNRMHRLYLNQDKWFCFVFGFIAVLYNPVFQIQLNAKELWMIANAFTAIVFLLKRNSAGLDD